MGIRRASHAGSWYSSSGRDLSRSLDGWLDEARGVAPATSELHAVIAPHAGYSYSGPSAAHAYCAIDPSKYETVFVLGPSHHEYLPNEAALTNARVLETPVGNLGVDQSINRKLLGENGKQDKELFFTMDNYVDEAEHSIEMHLPYLRHVFGDDAEPGGRVQFVPVMIGSLSRGMESVFGNIFAPWLADGKTLFVISTDFCHWGSRFRYTPRDNNGGEIWESIERLDREGMRAVETGSARFAEYLQRTQNTICGRFPVAVLLAAIEAKNDVDVRVNFVHYKQSSKCRHHGDSSVSYASAHVST